jgi:hypothetical protein
LNCLQMCHTNLDLLHINQIYKHFNLNKFFRFPKEYHRYRYVCFIPWPTPRNQQWGSVKDETLRQKRWFQFSHCELSKLNSLFQLPSFYRNLPGLIINGFKKCRSSFIMKALYSFHIISHSRNINMLYQMYNTG